MDISIETPGGKTAEQLARWIQYISTILLQRQKASWRCGGHPGARGGPGGEAAGGHQEDAGRRGGLELAAGQGGVARWEVLRLAIPTP